MNNIELLLLPFHLLKHPFYQDWNAGTLLMSDMQEYAKQYFHHESAFPRYLSTIHSKMTDPNARKIVLENLIDEEGGDRNHARLWLDYANAINVLDEEVFTSIPNGHTNELLNTFFALCEKSYISGLGAIYSYEYQIPDVSKTKIEGLLKHYNFSDKSRGLDFFTVHQEADIWHRDQIAKIYENFTECQKEEFASAALLAAKSLWNFLSGVHSKSAQSACVA